MMLKIDINPKEHEVLFHLIQTPIVRRVKFALSSRSFEFSNTQAALDRIYGALDAFARLEYSVTTLDSILCKIQAVTDL